MDAIRCFSQDQFEYHVVVRQTHFDFIFFMLGLLTIACFCETDIPTFKLDTICYADAESRDYCEQVSQTYNKDFWGSAWDLMKDTLGEYFDADASNARSITSKSDGYLVSIYVVSGMSGVNEDVFDLANFDGRKCVSVFDFSYFTRTLSSHEQEEKMKKFVQSQVKAIGKVKAMADKGRFASRNELVTAMATVLQKKQDKYFGNMRANSSAVALHPSTSWQTETAFTYITASQDIYSKVEYILMMPSNVVFQAEIHVPYLYIIFGLGSIKNPTFINADYLITDSSSVSTSEFKEIKFKDLGIMTLEVTKIAFSETGWTVYYDTSYGSWTQSMWISYDSVNGQLSVLAQSNNDISVSLTISSSYAAVEIRGLNLSVQGQITFGSKMLEYGTIEQPKPTLSVTFDDQWDSKVSNTPEIILESADPSTIQVYGQPSKVSIRKTSISDRPTPQGPEKGPNVGLIVGVVIAVIVVIGIIVAVVVVVIIMKKKEKVHPDEPDASSKPDEKDIQATTGAQVQGNQTAPASQQQSPQYQQPPPQYQQPPPQYQQPPPQYQQPLPQYQQPPPQYQYQQQPAQYQYQQPLPQYQQPPPQYQYQQPPPQYQYQQPPPQYQYQQPPQQKKQKHKSKHKKDAKK